MTTHTDDFHERLEGREPVMWRTRGPRGGWMATDKVPSFWKQIEPLYDEATILKLIAENRAYREALEKIANASVSQWAADAARAALTPTQQGGPSHG